MRGDGDGEAEGHDAVPEPLFVNASSIDSLRNKKFKKRCVYILPTSMLL